MSLESIALIGILTLFTIVLGTDLATLLAGHSVFEAIGPIAQGYTPANWRLGLVLLLLLMGAVTVNFVSATRTEQYLLRIGLGSLLVYFGLLFLSSVFGGDRTIKTVNADSQANLSLWYQAWTLLLWPRAIAALVSYWSFLHYAMNPKI
ncbi:MAG: hypothetical protein AAFZ17_00015 [Cyanobacteria bacterium J06650_10]